MSRGYLKKSRIIFSEKGIVGLLYSISDHILLRTRFFKVYVYYRYLLCLLTQRKAASHPYKVIKVNVDDIQYWKPNHDKYYLPERNLEISQSDAYDINIWRDAGTVINGGWDKSDDLIKIERMPKYQGLKEHFIHEIPWKKTSLFDILSNIIEEHGMIDDCTDEQELVERYEEIDELYNSIKQNGYRTMEDFNLTGDVKARYDEVGIVIGRRGEIIFQGEGWHRLSIAKILNIEKIPVRVIARHKEWQIVREKIAYCNNLKKLDDQTKQYLSHPDVQDLL